MSITVKPDLIREIKNYGAFDISACFQCGNCTAVCPLSSEEGSFPRKLIRFGQIGAEDRIVGSIEPWLCYYCGECSDTCPREAEPGEYMMTLRRFLIASYDWTGLARRFYKSTVAEITGLVLTGLFVTLLFVFFHGPMITDHVALNTFAPVHAIELGDIAMASVLTFFLLSNAFRMAWKYMGGAEMFRISPVIYIKQIPTFITHFFTQPRWRSCNEESKKSPWLTHLILISGYLSMLTLVLILLRWFQTDDRQIFQRPLRLWGYYATAALLYGTSSFMMARWKKTDTMHKISEPSDWIFLIMLFLTALTGIIMNAFLIADMPMATYVSYVIHLSIAVPMLVVEVPFGKWAHLLYRPLALYLMGVKSEAKAASAVTSEVTA
jgi:ferredoxin